MLPRLQISRLCAMAGAFGPCCPAAALGVAVGAVTAAGAGAADHPPVPALPSGLGAVLQEVLLDVKPDGMFTYARFRFVAPAIAGDGVPAGDGRSADMDFLCDEYALPVVLEGSEAVDRIAISISDRATEFGVADPEAIQFFELYRIENGLCIWEEF